ncbi:1592_t:CDS:2 [Paraglomus brasilianum]|uniref:1592_t:CDS:1 n=1 Tax=Paraglomus brasilianum TaxID=144538 RepID=A0A9N8Z7B5_9GLOM|nr:1592_t:CDS:2 [Paraglomus brasilianum]
MLPFKFPCPLRQAQFISPAYMALGFGRVMRERAGQQQRARRYEIAAYRSIGVERAFSEEKIKPPKSSSGLDLSSSLLVQQMLFSPKEKNSNDASREDVAENIEKIIEDDPILSKASH